MAFKLKKYIYIGLGVLVTFALVVVVVARRHEIPIVKVRPYFKQSTPASLPAGQYPVFERVGAETGLIRVKPTWGLSWNDFNWDGLPDLFVADHMHYPSALYINKGGLRFDEDARLGMQVGVDDHMTAWGDYDGSGSEDFFITTGFHRPKQLFKNHANGLFEDVAEEAGLRAGHTGSGRAGIMADFNADGWLDIVAFNTGTADIMFTNRGDGTFSNTTRESRTLNSLGKDGGAIGDLDGDGDIDLITMTYNGILLYMNRGDGVFVERSAEAGLVYPPPASRTGALGDYDNDGDLDLYFAQGVPGDLLLQNQGNGTFVEVTDAAGISAGGDGFRSASFVDLDNDGWLDIYVVDGGTDEYGNNPNLLLLNRGDGTFADISRIADAEVNVAGNAASAAFADFNYDGFLDMAIGHGLGVHQISGPVVLLKNSGKAALAPDKCGNWIHLFPDKRHGSRNGTGASARLVLSDGRVLYRQAASGQRPLSQDAPGIHVGLGCADSVEQLTVHWPDGSFANLKSVPANDFVLVAAEPNNYRNRHHPAYLLGENAAVEREISRLMMPERALASPILPPPALLAQRRNEVLAYAMVRELAGDIVVTDEQVEAYYTDNIELFTVPELYRIERVVAGVFTPRKKQPKLPWKVAKQVASDLEETGKTAFHVAHDRNVRAWSFTDRKVGRYWDIEGETRGFAESGWFTHAMLEERFDGELARQIVGSQPGTVIGPLQRKERSILFEVDSVPQLLDVIKMDGKKEARIVELAAVQADIRRMLMRRQLAESIDRLTTTGLSPAARMAEPRGYFKTVQYEIDAMANAARRSGLPNSPHVARALRLIEIELAGELELSRRLQADSPTNAEIEAHIASRRKAWEQGEALMLRHLFFAHEKDGERAVELLAEGASLDSVLRDMKIGNLNSKEGRGSSNYYEDMLLDSRLASMGYGLEAYEAARKLEPGAVTPLVFSNGSYHLFQLQERISDEVGDEGVFRSLAEREIRLRREYAIIDGGPKAVDRPD